MTRTLFLVTLSGPACELLEELLEGHAAVGQEARALADEAYRALRYAAPALTVIRPEEG